MNLLVLKWLMAKGLADLIDTWQDETYESIYNIAIRERNNKNEIDA